MERKTSLKRSRFVESNPEYVCNPFEGHCYGYLPEERNLLKQELKELILANPEQKKQLTFALHTFDQEDKCNRHCSKLRLPQDIVSLIQSFSGPVHGVSTKMFQPKQMDPDRIKVYFESQFPTLDLTTGPATAYQIPKRKRNSRFSTTEIMGCYQSASFSIDAKKEDLYF